MIPTALARAPLVPSVDADVDHCSGFTTGDPMLLDDLADLLGRGLCNFAHGTPGFALWSQEFTRGVSVLSLRSIEWKFLSACSAACFLISSNQLKLNGLHGFGVQ